MSRTLSDDFDDNPAWTDEDFAVGVPADQLHPPHVAALLVRCPSAWEEITLELDQDVIAKFRATGPGWQTRINEVLRAAEPIAIQSDAA